jgi:hypothetical protein
MKIVTLFMVVVVLGSQESMCTLFRVAEDGRLSWQPTKAKRNSEIQDAMIGLSKIIQIAQKF